MNRRRSRAWGFGAKRASRDWPRGKRIADNAGIPAKHRPGVHAAMMLGVIDADELLREPTLDFDERHYARCFGFMLSAAFRM